jgi:hypothetical protein
MSRVIEMCGIVSEAEDTPRTMTTMSLFTIPAVLIVDILNNLAL